MAVQLTVWYAVAVTATVIVALTAGHWLLKRETIIGLEKLHEAEFREVVQQLGENPGVLTEAQLIARMERHAAADEHLFFFQIHNESGRLLFRSANLGETILPNLTPVGNSWTADIPLHGRVHGAEFQQGPLHFQIGSRLEPMERLLGQYIRIGLLLTGIVAAGSMGLGYGFSRLALNPIRAIERTARQIGADNLDERIPVPPGKDEVSRLVTLLNAMFDRLETSFCQIGQFSADVSHELKTPLTLVRLNAERLRARLSHDHESAAHVDSLLEEISRMNRVIEGLLFLAKAENGGIKPAREMRATRPFMESLTEDARVLAEDAGVTLVLGENDKIDAPFDPGLLRQVLLNLVSNAVAAMPGGGTIRLRSRASGSLWKIEVLDEGPGLPPGDLDRIFGRFVRVQPAGANRGAGSGLGLPISRSIALLHGGTLRAANRADRTGLCMTVEVPVG